MPAYDMSMPLNGGTNRNKALQAKLAAGSSIRRAKWHSRKRMQMLMVPRRHDWATLQLAGAATRERQEKAKEKREADESAV